jgi:hypothetical protein
VEEETKMTVREAAPYVGRDCAVTWKDRYGSEQVFSTHIYKLGFVPLYGSYIMGDVEDVFLNKVVRILPLD